MSATQSPSTAEGGSTTRTLPILAPDPSGLPQRQLSLHRRNIQVDDCERCHPNEVPCSTGERCSNCEEAQAHCFYLFPPPISDEPRTHLFQRATTCGRVVPLTDGGGKCAPPGPVPSRSRDIPQFIAPRVAEVQQTPQSPQLPPPLMDPAAAVPAFWSCDTYLWDGLASANLFEPGLTDSGALLALSGFMDTGSSEVDVVSSAVSPGETMDMTAMMYSPPEDFFPCPPLYSSPQQQPDYHSWVGGIQPGT